MRTRTNLHVGLKLLTRSYLASHASFHRDNRIIGRKHKRIKKSRLLKCFLDINRQFGSESNRHFTYQSQARQKEQV